MSIKMKLLVVTVTCLCFVYKIDAKAACAEVQEKKCPGKRVSYEGSQLWKIESKTPALKILEELQNQKYLSIWGKSADTVDTLIESQYLDAVKQRIEENNLDYNITIEDIQKAIDEENPPIEEELDNRQGHPLSWNRYHKLADIYQFLEYIDLTFPKLCSLQTIGYSVEGRPIKLLKLSNGNKDNKAIFIDGGIHAREWITPATVTYIINKFVYNFDKEAWIRNIDWYIIPVLNPDGYEYSHNVDRLWRKNRKKQAGTDCIGVDLNRNFGYLWDNEGSSKEPCQRTFRGSKPFSEPETNSIAQFFQNNKQVNWRGFISFHSYGQFIVYPWGAVDAKLQDAADLEKVALEAATKIVSNGGVSYTVGPTGITIYRASGSSTDWARGNLGIKYAYTVELRDAGRYGFLLPARDIEVTSQEALVLLQSTAKAAAAA